MISFFFFFLGGAGGFSRFRVRGFGQVSGFQGYESSL